MDFAALCSYIEECVREEGAGEEHAVEFRPLRDANLGDLGSDILKIIAKVRRESPEAIAARVLPRLQSSSFGQFQVVDGFLNLTLSEALLGSPVVEVPAPRAPRSIVVAPPHRGVDLVGYARVVASAATHWSLTSAHSTLISRQGTLETNAAPAELQRWVAETLKATTAEGISRENLSGLVAALPKGASVLWLYPDFLDRSRFKEFLTSVRSQLGGELLLLQCLDRELLTTISDTIDAVQTLVADMRYLAPTCLYLARGTLGGDLDVAIPRNQERANLWWSLPTLQTRLSRAAVGAAKESHDPSAFPAGSIGALERMILVRAKLMPLFLADAVQSGAVVELLGAIEDLVEGCTRYLNNPQIRRALDAGAPPVATGAIISGALRSSSAIIQTCRLFQGPEPVQL
jgi:hypothetical protein